MANRRQLDPYRATVQYHELEELRGHADAFFRLQIDSLCRRGNPNGCLSGFYRVEEDLWPRQQWRITLFFDPYTWTGHDGSTPIDIARRWWAKLRR